MPGGNSVFTCHRNFVRYYSSLICKIREELDRERKCKREHFIWEKTAKEGSRGFCKLKSAYHLWHEDILFFNPLDQ